MGVEQPSKQCRICGTVKPLTEFPIGRANRDGRVSRCKACQRAYSRERYAATKGRLVPDPRPARTLRVTLHQLRQDGLAFSIAWPTAVDRALTVAGDPTWAGAFRWSRSAWQHAYEGRPPERGERLRVVPDDLSAA